MFVKRNGMSRKEILTKNINFGRKGELAREVAEKVIKKYGNRKFSKIVRNALVCYISAKPEFKNSKIQMLKEKRKQLKKKIPEISKELTENEQELERLGYKLKSGE